VQRAAALLDELKNARRPCRDVLNGFAAGSDPTVTSEGRWMNRIALLIPVFQNQAGLDRSIQALRNSSVIDVIVVDDGSSPAIREPQIQGPHRLTILRQPVNQGITTALNAGLEHVLAGDYQYVARLDAGDIAAPERFSTQASFLDQHEHIALVGTAVQYVSSDGTVLFTHRLPQTHRAIRHEMFWNSAFCHPSVMMRTSAIRSIGLYSEEYPAAEDYDLFYRLIQRYEAANLQDVLTIKELAKDSISVQRRTRQLWSRLKIQTKHYRPLSIGSHLGIAATLASLLLPHEIVLQGKKWLRSSRR
jgi:glycosyltransferase involved in cell wall biosynthesis